MVGVVIMDRPTAPRLLPLHATRQPDGRVQLSTTAIANGVAMTFTSTTPHGFPDMAEKMAKVIR